MRTLGIFAVLFAGASLLPVSAPAAQPQPAPRSPASRASRPDAIGPHGPIKHVIVIILENRTFDNVFNGFPGADTVTYGYDHLGNKVPLKATPYVGPCDPDHSHEAWVADYNGGKMNGFDTTPASCVGITPRPTVRMHTCRLAKYRHISPPLRN